MAGHGLQKLRGSFGGGGLARTEEMMRGIGMHPPALQARLVALTETCGGALTALGLFSPLGPAMICGTMATAIRKVHLKNGLWNSKRGYEYNLTLLAASIALAADGPGALSLDRLRGHERSGLVWGLAALGLGIGAAAANDALSERLRPAEPSSPAEEPAPDAADATTPATD